MKNNFNIKSNISNPKNLNSYFHYPGQKEKNFPLQIKEEEDIRAERINYIPNNFVKNNNNNPPNFFPYENNVFLYNKSNKKKK